MSANTQFHMCWLRESSAGHLDSDLGTAVSASRLELALMGLVSDAVGEASNHRRLEASHVIGALQSLDRVQALPKWLHWRLSAFFGPLHTAARVEQARQNYSLLSAACDRIREAAGNRAEVQVHLPYFNRRDWIDRFRILSQMQFVERNGWIQAENGADPLSLRDIVLRVSSGVFQPRPDQDLPLQFLYDGPLAQPWASNLISRWGTVFLPPGQHVQFIDLRVAASAIDGWRKSPRLHHGRYHIVWARVALAVQWILRRWNVALQLSVPEGIEDVAASCHALLFASMRPWAENARSELYYDVMDEARLHTAFRKAGRRMEAELAKVADLLERCGNPALALQYRGADPPLHAATIADRGERGKAVRGMLAAETCIINALMRYSQDVRAAASPNAIRHATDALTGSFSEQLPRIFRMKPMPPHLGAAIFLEATAAMHTALGGQPPLDTCVQTADGCWYHAAHMPISDVA